MFEDDDIHEDEAYLYEEDAESLDHFDEKQFAFLDDLGLDEDEISSRMSVPASVVHARYRQYHEDDRSDLFETELHYYGFVQNHILPASEEHAKEARYTFSYDNNDKKPYDTDLDNDLALLLYALGVEQQYISSDEDKWLIQEYETIAKVVGKSSVNPFVALKKAFSDLGIHCYVYQDLEEVLILLSPAELSYRGTILNELRARYAGVTVDEYKDEMERLKKDTAYADRLEKEYQTINAGNKRLFSQLREIDPKAAEDLMLV